MRKRMIATLCLILCLSLFNGYNISAKNIYKDKEYQSRIINEVIQLDSFNSMDVKQVSIKSNSRNISVSEQGFIISAFEGEVAVAIPLKLDENGDLVNSFVYAEQQLKNSGFVAHNLVDVVAYCNAYYDNLATESYLFYRHNGLRVYWAPSSSAAGTITISNLYVTYETVGDLVPYPDALYYNYSQLQASVITQNYSKVSSLYCSTEPYVENSDMNGMPDNRVVWCHNFFGHGGYVYAEVSYTVNGSYKSYNTQSTVYYGN